MSHSNPQNPKFTTGGIQYFLMEGYPKIVADRESMTATEKYRIAAASLEAFIVESLPQPTVFRGQVRIPNARQMPGAPILFTRSISAEPLNGSRPMDPFGVFPTMPEETFDDECVVTIQYETQLKDEDDETLFEHTINVGGEFFTLPPQRMRLEDQASNQRDITTEINVDGLPANKDQMLPTSQVVPTIEHNYRFPMVINPNWLLFQQLLGTVNTNKPDRNRPAGGPLVPGNWQSDTSFHIGVPDAEQETVMFMGVSGSQKIVMADSQTILKPWEIDLKFSQRNVTKENPFPQSNQPDQYVYGWNHTYVPDQGKWLRLWTADGETIHRFTNHNQIFMNTSNDDDDDDGGGTGQT